MEGSFECKRRRRRAVRFPGPRAEGFNARSYCCG
jgi:hypothetical protein